MKQFFYTIMLTAIALSASSQITLERQVIGSTGGYHETNSGDIKVSSTVGEAITTTEKTSDESLILTQGFQQPGTFVPELDLFIYNGFTPNGDGANDLWIIDGIEQYPTNTVYIFNRWGDKLWQQDGYDNVNTVWDGANGDGAKVPIGTYFYVISIPDANPNHYEGWVQIVN